MTLFIFVLLVPFVVNSSSVFHHEEHEGHEGLCQSTIRLIPFFNRLTLKLISSPTETAASFI